MADTDLLEPSVDPKTRKLTYRNLTAHNEGGDKTVVSVRDTPDLVIDHPIERVYRLARVFRIGGGTSEIQRRLVARGIGL